MFEVQKNIPLPPKARGSNKRGSKYPFKDMAVGDMFFVPERTKNTLMGLASSKGKELGMKFSTRLCTMKKTKSGWVLCKPEAIGAVRGVGCWRDE